MPRVARWVVLLMVAVVAMGFAGCSSSDDSTQADATTAAADQPGGLDQPALWRVADADTTVYLFGTFHLLPRDVEWFGGRVETAFRSSDVLVTEISGDAEAAAVQLLDDASKLPPGERLRDRLTDAQRATYESAMSTVGAPAAAFDDREPWFAALAVSALLWQREGFDPTAGAEAVLEREAGAEMQRAALETPEFQAGLFDSLPDAAQVRLLMETVGSLDQAEPLLDRMLTAWRRGDDEAIAELLNANVTQSGLMDVLLYQRNRAWAGWIDERLDTPGTVFVAVGAGHLAGEQSVQDALAERGITTTRIQ